MSPSLLFIKANMMGRGRRRGVQGPLSTRLPIMLYLWSGAFGYQYAKYKLTSSQESRGGSLRRNCEMNAASGCLFVSEPALEGLSGCFSGWPFRLRKNAVTTSWSLHSFCLELASAPCQNFAPPTARSRLASHRSSSLTPTLDFTNMNCLVVA